jgi:hypothetical protein
VARILGWSVLPWGINASILWVIATLLLAVFAGLRGRIALPVALAAIVAWWLFLDFTPHYDTGTFDLANLRGLNLFINYWVRATWPIPFYHSTLGRKGISVSQLRSVRD